MSDIVKLYNPANSDTLTPEQLAGLQNLTTDELKLLAKAYPNGSMKGAYLLIIDGSKPADRQLPSLSTFQNLYNLRIRNNSKFVAYSFRGRVVARPITPLKSKRTEVLDLSETELMNLPGFKVAKGTTKESTIEPQTVEVTKVKTAKKAPKKVKKS